jgi:serine protease Do
MRASPIRLIVITALVTSVTTVGLSAIFGSNSPFSLQGHPAYASIAGNNPHLIANVAQRVTPSVVNISITKRVRVNRMLPFHPFFGQPFDRGGQRLRQGQGSGVIISSDGVVVTNNHVVAGAATVKVTLHDKREFRAKVLGRDPKSDLAVIKLEGARGLKPLPIGDSKKLRLGDIVLAVGNPFGIGQTVTMGIVSAKGRANMGIVDYEDFIQTDAAINPGNSGGALVNLRGELVGINTAILSRSGGYQGIGFAIPTHLSQPIVRSLRKSGRVVRGYLGVMIQDVTPELAKAIGAPSSRGVLISDVVSGGPAARAGLRRGDVVVSIDGVSTPDAAKLRNLVAAAGKGKSLSLKLYRGRSLRTLTVKTGVLPSKYSVIGSKKAPAHSSGLSLAPLDSTSRRRFSISRRIRFGVVVTKVQPGSKAAIAGLRSGDVILEANRVKIDNVSRFARVYQNASGHILTLVFRQNATVYLILPK